MNSILFFRKINLIRQIFFDFRLDINKELAFISVINKFLLIKVVKRKTLLLYYFRMIMEV